MDYLSKLRHICALIRNAEPKIFYLTVKHKAKRLKQKADYVKLNQVI
jgi:hypothetical protein